MKREFIKIDFTEVSKLDDNSPFKCQDCKLFPVCTGICSQKIIEMGDKTPCIIDAQFSIEDYILYNYKVNQILKIRNS